MKVGALLLAFSLALPGFQAAICLPTAHEGGAEGEDRAGAGHHDEEPQAPCACFTVDVSRDKAMNSPAIPEMAGKAAGFAPTGFFAPPIGVRPLPPHANESPPFCPLRDLTCVLLL